MHKQKRWKYDKKTEDYLKLLINSYKVFKPKNNSSFKEVSFLKHYVNDFIDSFEKMILKLKKQDLTLQD